MAQPQASAVLSTSDAELLDAQPVDSKLFDDGEPSCSSSAVSDEDREETPPPNPAFAVILQAPHPPHAGVLETLAICKTAVFSFFARVVTRRRLSGLVLLISISLGCYIFSHPNRRPQSPTQRQPFVYTDFSAHPVYAQDEHDLRLPLINIHQPLQELASALDESLPYFDHNESYSYTHVSSAMQICDCPLRWDWRARQYDQSEASESFTYDFFSELHERKEYQHDSQWLTTTGIPSLKPREWDERAQVCLNLQRESLLRFDYYDASSVSLQPLKKHFRTILGISKTRPPHDRRHDTVKAATRQVRTLVENMLNDISSVTHMHYHDSLKKPNPSKIAWDLINVYGNHLGSLQCTSYNQNAHDDQFAPLFDDRFADKWLKKPQAADRLFGFAEPKKMKKLKNPRAEGYSQRSMHISFWHSHFSSTLKLIRYLNEDAGFFRQLASNARDLSITLQPLCGLDGKGQGKNPLCHSLCVPWGWKSRPGPTLEESYRYHDTARVSWLEGLDDLDRQADVLETRARKLVAILGRIDLQAEFLQGLAKLHGLHDAQPFRWHEAPSLEVAGHHPDFGVVFEVDDTVRCTNNGYNRVQDISLSSAPICPSHNHTRLNMGTEAELLTHLWSLLGFSLTDAGGDSGDAFREDLAKWRNFYAFARKSQPHVSRSFGVDLH